MGWNDRVRISDLLPNNGECSIMVVQRIVIPSGVSSTLIIHPKDALADVVIAAV